MARNIEIKARIDSIGSMLPKVADAATSGPIEIDQRDTFFRCDTGRLKLREFPDGSGELIFYQRADEAGPKASFFLRSITSMPESLKQSLTLAYGQAGTVVKRRTLFMVGRTLVQLDVVEELGHFLELEVVLGDGEAAEAGLLEAHELMTRLGIEPHQLVQGAYLDLLAGP